MDLTVKDAAKLLHTTEKTIYRWIHEGTLPSYRISDKYRLNRVDLLEWATARNIRISPQFFHRPDEPDALSPSLLTDAIRTGGVLYGLAGADKPAALRAVCDKLTLPDGVNRDDLYGVLLAREALGSTAIGHGIAIPHPRSPVILSVKTPTVTLAFLEHPIDFGALDGRPVTVLFTIISTTVRIHLQLLTRLMGALQEPRFRALLAAQAPAEQLLATLQEVETGFARNHQPAGAQA